MPFFIFREFRHCGGRGSPTGGESPLTISRVMPVKNNTFGVAQQTPFALHKRNNANSIYYSFFCPETSRESPTANTRGISD